MPTRLVTRCGPIARGLLIVLVSTGSVLPGQAPAIDADSTWFSGWSQRYTQLQAYEKTPAPKLEDAAKREVISWLNREADFAAHHYQSTGKGLDESYGDYYIDLTLFVVQLKDARSIGALTKVTDVAPRVSTTLAEFGELAVEPVLAQLGDPLLRDSTVYTLGKFIEGNGNGHCHLGEASIGKIRQALLAAVLDREPAIRTSAAGALKYFRGDAEVIRTLRQLALADEYVGGRDSKTGEWTYPVREAAAAALDEIDKAHARTQ